MNFPLWRLFTQDDACFGSIGRLLAGGCVMHLKDQFVALRDSDTGSLRHNDRFFADGHTADRRESLFLLRTDLAHVDDNVVDDSTVSWSWFDRLHPEIVIDIRGDDEVLVLNGSGGRNSEFFLHLENHVRLTDVPAAGKFWRFGNFFLVPQMRPFVNPRE